MKLEWSKWQGLPEDTDPYIHWSLDGPGEAPIMDSDHTRHEEDQLLLMFPPADWGDPGRFVFHDIKKPIPIPKPAVNLDCDGTITIDLPDKDRIPGCDPTGNEPEDETRIAKDTIIAGVIDVGIPLGHSRWRLANGKTRLLAAWQMIGDWALKSEAKIPFGCEFYEKEINAKLTEHCGGSLLGRLDEQAFNTDTGVLLLRRGIRYTDVARHASHGAHVLDLMAGTDPVDEADFARRVRIIAINAPSSETFGSAGVFLDYYMFHAIQRIVDMADSIWLKQQEFDPENVPEKGYPIVINLSFGKQAGAKDERDMFASELDCFNDEREKSGKLRVDFIMPAGNDNQTRCNALFRLKHGAGAKEVLNWCVLPQDQSSNFVELWVDGHGLFNFACFLDLVAPSGSSRPHGCVWGMCRAFYADLKDADSPGAGPVARIYIRRYAANPALGLLKGRGCGGRVPSTRIRTRYILCIAPTYRPLNDGPSAPGGLWQIRLSRPWFGTRLCAASIQTDQSVTPNRSVNLRSYFDDPAYQRHDETGRVLDSYSYPPDDCGNVENLDIRARESRVRRHGTMNASAAHKAVARIAGYRLSDGRPATYSATGVGRASGQDAGLDYGSGSKSELKARAPTVAFPSDDGYAHFGLLAAGAADGSVVAMRGTSFASAQAARFAINHHITGNTGTAKQAMWLKGRDEECNPAVRKYPWLSKEGLTELIEVIGGGRAPRQSSRKPLRY